LRPLALALCEEGNALVLLCAKQGDQVQYVLCVLKSLGIDAGELIQAVNAALNGKGGGRDQLAQGSAPYTRGFEEALIQVEEYFLKRLK
jgi:alanyl-tRNA synthetase